jgi:serine/threonine protein kinase
VREQVYTVVNLESGQLLAMKELAVGAGDRRALQRAANELRVLEGVLHPHLVRYYGCELHRVRPSSAFHIPAASPHALAFFIPFY